jgi:hypothetical protein
MDRRIGYKTPCWYRLRLSILILILMGLASYIRNRLKQRKLLMTQHDSQQKNEYRDEEERREADSCLEHRLREEVRRYEDDLRELAKT